MYTVKIVADSSADVKTVSDVPFLSIPLKIITAHKEYIDDDSLQTEDMIHDLFSYKGKSSTSCPNSQEWLEAFEDAENVICITITGTLSGSYNAACIAKTIYEEKYPERNVFVVNSLSAGPELKLLIEKAAEGIALGYSFQKICEDIEQYQKSTGLLFMLESMKNLANNGRVSPLVAKAVGLLGIRILGKASDKGDLQPLDKCRGEEKGLTAVIHRLKENGCKNGKVRIAHCLNEATAIKLKEKIEKEIGTINIEIYPCGGLCGFYAEKGGLLIGFETF
ncbi:MAG: DegV family protein [Clostridia bacterium]|nr:DegV family protein [Clostridia bacterium]